MSRPHNVTDPAFRIELTIAEDASHSDAADLTKLGPRGLGVLIPAAWTAADLGLETSIDEDTWYPVYDNTKIDGIVTTTKERLKITDLETAEAGVYLFPGSAWIAGVFPFLRLVSLDTSDESLEVQSAARQLLLLVLS